RRGRRNGIAVVEGRTWPSKTARPYLCGGEWLVHRGITLDRQDDDALEPPHIHELIRQRPRARRLQAFGGVALAEPEQLLDLAQLGPRQRSFEQPNRESVHAGPQAGGLTHQAIRCTQRVGGEVGWVMAGIGGASASGLAEVALDQLTAAVELNQGPVAADLKDGAWRAAARRCRVQRALEADVVIRMDR